MLRKDFFKLFFRAFSRVFLAGLGLVWVFRCCWYGFICLCKQYANPRKKSTVKPQRSPDNVADHATGHYRGTELAKLASWEIPGSEVLPCEAWVPCCCNLLFTTLSKCRQEGCVWASAVSGYSRLLEQPPLGPEASKLKPITTMGKARGLKHHFSPPGAKPSIY